MISKKINILGVEYHVLEKNEAEDAALKELNGYCDYSTKMIVIADEEHYKSDDINTPEFGNIANIQQKVLRHEILHAFFWESGLSGYAADETLIDCLAIQLPKISELLRGEGNGKAIT